MIGFTIGLLCILVVSGLCSVCFKMDLKWWISLSKPAFVLSGVYFSLFVSASYLSSLLAISRLVEHKHIFPSMIYFFILGVGCVLFMLFFFTLQNLLGALIFSTVVLGVSYALFMRFLSKDIKIAIEFLPTLIFNIYSFLCTIAIFMNN